MQKSRRDEAEPAVVEALEKAGWEVHKKLPTDLLAIKHKGGQLVLKLVEVKTPHNKNGTPKKRKDQAEQDEFLERHKIPRTCTPFEALLAVGEVVELCGHDDGFHCDETCEEKARRFRERYR